jgi:hypothetical protein
LSVASAGARPIEIAMAVTCETAIFGIEILVTATLSVDRTKIGAAAHGPAIAAGVGISAIGRGDGVTAIDSTPPGEYATAGVIAIGTTSRSASDGGTGTVGMDRSGITGAILPATGRFIGGAG